MLRRGGSLIGGLILILIGSFFLLRLWLPLPIEINWALFVVAIGLIFLIAAALSGVGGLAIPGCIVGGIGAILYYQNISGNWESWAYLWTLIPGFIGIGIIIASLFNPHARIDASGWFLILLSSIGFILFGGILGGVAFFGVDITTYWPLVLILIGVYHLLHPWMRVRSRSLRNDL